MKHFDKLVDSVGSYLCGLRYVIHVGLPTVNTQHSLKILRNQLLMTRISVFTLFSKDYFLHALSFAILQNRAFCAWKFLMKLFEVEYGMMRKQIVTLFKQTFLFLSAFGILW